jgi:hypothetical protein
MAKPKQRPGNRPQASAAAARPAAGQSVPGQAAPAQTAPAEPAAKAAPEAAASGKATSGQAASGKATSDQAASRKAASGQASSGQASSGRAVSGKTASGQAASGQAAQGKAAQGKAAWGKAARGKAAPGQAGPGQAGPGSAAAGRKPGSRASSGALVSVREPEPVPRSVQIAVWLMYAGAGLAALDLIATLATIGSARGELHRAHPGWSAALLTTEVHSFILSIVVSWAITIGVWVIMARTNLAGRAWARNVATVLSALSTLSFILYLHEPGALIGKILLAPMWLVGIAAAALLWRRESTAYIRAGAA